MVQSVLYSNGQLSHVTPFVRYSDDYCTIDRYFFNPNFFQHQDDQGSQDPNVDVQSLLPGAFDSGKPRGALSVF